MKSKSTRKKRSDRNHVIYVIRNSRNGQEYIGLTALAFRGNANRTITRRFQKHVQRALTEDKNWGLCRAIRKYGVAAFTISVKEIVRGKAEAHQREAVLINTLKPKLNTHAAA
jgi:hypothetical protein